MWNVNRIRQHVCLLPVMLATILLSACSLEESLTLGALVISEVTDNAVHCSVAVDGAIPIDCGFYYATSKEEVQKNSAKRVRGTCILSEINGTIEGLSPNTTYHIRAYAMNIRGKVYTETVEVKTSTRLPDSSDNEYPGIEP